MSPSRRALIWLMISGAISALGLAACAPSETAREARRGDEIVVCGQMFHTGTAVVLWSDPDGYNAYRTEPAATPSPGARAPDPKPPTGPRFGARDAILSTSEADDVKARGWSLDLLRRHVDQFVIHYDACGTSRACFHVLHDVRGLSVHFMIDLDGTIYQTLDLKERAWHATTSNDRSVGVEIASIGAFPVGAKDTFDRWYAADGPGRTKITVPPDMGELGIRSHGFVARPARPAPIVGQVQGQTLRMYDLTPQQYESLTHLTATLCTVLPAIQCEYPRDSAGGPVTKRLTDEQLRTYRGLLGHFHIQDNKADPGPAFQWDLVVEGARRLMQDAALGNKSARAEPPNARRL